MKRLTTIIYVLRVEWHRCWAIYHHLRFTYHENEHVRHKIKTIKRPRHSCDR